MAINQINFREVNKKHYSCKIDETRAKSLVHNFRMFILI